MVKKVQYDMLIMCVKKVFLRANALQRDKLPCTVSSSLQEVLLMLGIMPPYVRIPEEGGEGGEGRRKEAHLSNAWNAAKKRSPSILFLNPGHASESLETCC